MSEFEPGQNDLAPTPEKKKAILDFIYHRLTQVREDEISEGIRCPEPYHPDVPMSLCTECFGIVAEIPDHPELTCVHCHAINTLLTDPTEIQRFFIDNFEHIAKKNPDLAQEAISSTL